MKKSISLVIPVYNVESWLAECLESAVNQSAPFKEVVIINDGSTDSSIEICRSYVKKYGYFKLIDQENQGLSAARNAGIKAASGEYIMFLDSDDWLRADSVRILEGLLEEGRPDVIYFDADTFCEADTVVDFFCCYDRSRAGIDGEVMSGRAYFERIYPQNYVVSACLGVYRKEAIEKLNVQFPEGLYYEDNYFTFLLLSNVKSVIHVSEKLYQRRYRTGSIMTGKYTLRNFMDYVKIVKLIWEYILEQNGWERKELLNKYVSDQCEAVLDKYVFCKEHNIEPDMETERLLEGVLCTYMQLLNSLENCSTERKIEDEIKVYKQLVYIEKLERKQLKSELSFLKWKEKLEVKLMNSYKKILSNLPLNIPTLKVGIYGRGKHTEGLFFLYEKLLGEIECEVVFIDTYADKCLYQNRDVINYKNVDSSFHYVILSSFLYREEMLNHIRTVNKTVHILNFYETVKTDIFSIFSNA